MNACSWTQVPYSALTEETKKIAQDRVAWLFAELPLTSEEKESLKYAFMKTPYKDWGSKFFTERTKEPYKPPPYPNEYKGIKKRKVASLIASGSHFPPSPDQEFTQRFQDELPRNFRWDIQRDVGPNINFQGDAPPLQNAARGRFVAAPMGPEIPPMPAGDP